ncbi:MAG: hypothetical protein K6G10_05770 [Butyrivibrio sp.]|nr:hypothetical protein [Butyrivibrio sp.]
MTAVVSKEKIFLQGLVKVVLVLLIIGVIATPLIGTMYTYPSEDDFSYESGGLQGAAEYQSAIKGSFYKTVNIYKMQQGCYTPMFLDHLLIPYSRFGLPGFHVAVFSYVAICIASLIAVSFTLVKDKTASLTLILAAMMSIFTMSQSGQNKDIIFWHTETLGFTLMIGFMFFGLFFSILSFRSKGAKCGAYIALASVLAFLASGASLTVVAVNCGILLAVLILDYEEFLNRKFLAIPFIFGFVGALINAVAPGNFARSDESAVPGHETLLDGIRDTFACFFHALPKAIDIVFILVAIVVFAVCIIYRVQVLKGSISGIRMIIVVGGVLLLQIMELFPAAYGSHTDKLPGHLAIEHNIITRLTVLFVVICFAQFAREHFIKEKIVSNLAIWRGVWVVAVALMLILPISRGIIDKSFTARTYRDFTSGTFTRVYKIREYELSFFDMAEEGTDAILYAPWDVSSESMVSLGITADSEWFVNRSAANLYNLHTTTVLIP